MDTQRVSRHLGLLLCNIGIMKRFLTLFILTGLLFGQDTTLVLKNGKIIEGTIVSETDNYYTMIVKSTSLDIYCLLIVILENKEVFNERYDNET